MFLVSYILSWHYWQTFMLGLWELIQLVRFVSFRSSEKNDSTKICQLDLNCFVENEEDLSQGLSENEQIKCRWCGNVCDNLTSYCIHIEDCKKQKKIYKCGICNKLLKKRRSIKEHLMTEHIDANLKACPFCKKEFESNKKLRPHFRTCKIKWRNRKAMKCRYCDRKIKSRSLFLHHVKRCKPYPCTCYHCMKSFSCLGKLEKHLTESHSKKHFDCELCRKTFLTRDHLSRHITNDHFKSKRPKTAVKNILCSICSKAFSKRKAMLDHQIISMSNMQ